jgi:hypothetical protein
MSPKKISHRDIIGDRGIALIHKIVGDMGFVWNPTGLEAGSAGRSSSVLTTVPYEINPILWIAAYLVTTDHAEFDSDYRSQL